MNKTIIYLSKRPQKIFIRNHKGFIKYTNMFLLKINNQKVIQHPLQKNNLKTFQQIQRLCFLKGIDFIENSFSCDIGIYSIEEMDSYKEILGAILGQKLNYVNKKCVENFLKYDDYIFSN